MGTNDFISLFQDDFVAGVKHALEGTDIKPVFVDPSDFTKKTELGREPINNIADVTQQHVEKFKNTFTDQGASELIQGLSDEQLKPLIIAYANASPHAGMPVELQDGQTVCVLPKLQDDMTSKEAIFGHLSKIREQGYSPQSITGKDYEWQHALGIHEGTHCIQSEDFNNRADAKDTQVVTLRMESEADQETYEWLKERNPELAEDYLHARSLGTVLNHEHATAPALGEDYSFSSLKIEHAHAANTFVEKMDTAVAERLGITLEEAENVRRFKPERYVETLEESLKQGSIDPNAETYAKNFAHAVKEIVLGQEIEGTPARFDQDTKSIPDDLARTQAIKLVAMQLASNGSAEPSESLQAAEDLLNEDPKAFLEHLNEEIELHAKHDIDKAYGAGTLEVLEHFIEKTEKEVLSQQPSEPEPENEELVSSQQTTTPPNPSTI